jgi:hypothetical protein
MIKLESEEYSRLCFEIDSNTNRIFNVISIVIGVYSVVVGIGIDAKNEYIILCSLLPVIPALIVISSQYNSTNRISSYLRLFYEGKEHSIFWETRMEMLRNKKTNNTQYKLAISLIFLLLGIIGILVSFYFFYLHISKLENDVEYNLSLILYLFLVVMIVFGYLLGFIKLYKSTKSGQFFDKYWNSIK